MKIPRTVYFILIGLALVTLAVYWQVHSFEFISFDDDIYVYENEHVKNGITPGNLLWALNPVNAEGTYWHPLSWLSHMLDVELFGLNPGGHHLVNLLFHILNVFLLFLAMFLMTGAAWKSAFVAALFALHPINVDSVAWIAERKNLLSTTFWMLTMLAYIRYARKPTIARYLIVFLTLALGLLAKPMLVTLPCVLLLLDYWPMGRMRFGQSLPIGSETKFHSNRLSRLMMEKVPLIVLSLIITGIFAYSLQHNRQLINLTNSPLSLRLENALVSYITYLWKLIWPAKLAVFYPYPKEIPFWKTLGAAMLLLTISIPMMTRIKTNPYFSIGWFWYLGTLVPAIGLIQGGLMPALADRWAYVPAIGIFIIIAWSGSELFKWACFDRKTLIALGAAIFCVIGILAHRQTGHWRNNQTLFQHALAVTSGNHMAHINLGIDYTQNNKLEKALHHFQEAIRIQPDMAEAHYNMGNALFETGRIEEALTSYQHAIQLYPDYAQAHFNLGIGYEKVKRNDEAIPHYLETIRIHPGHAKANYHLALLLSRAGRHGEALAYYLKALEINPEDPNIHYNCANTHNALGKTDQAVAHLRQAIAMEPGHEKALNNIAVILLSRGQAADAIPYFIKAMQINPQYSSVHYNLGIAYFKTGNKSGAIGSFKEALRLNPGAPHIQAALNMALNMP